jgi:co-chaperonin GroES (HSP10)
MGKQLDELVMLGDGVLVEKPIINEKVGSLYLSEEAQSTLLDMHKGKVVKVGPGSANQTMEVQEGDMANIVKGPQYATIMLDNKEYWVLAQHNILFVNRPSK